MALRGNNLAEAKRLIKNISRRMARIKARGLEEYSKAYQRFSSLEVPNKKVGTYLNDLSDLELQGLVNNLEYVNLLEGSRVKGVKNIKEKYIKSEETFREKIKAYSPETRKRFWSAYNKLIELNADMRRFKYNFMEDVDYILELGATDDDIVNTVENMVRQIELELGRERDLVYGSIRKRLRKSNTFR